MSDHFDHLKNNKLPWELFLSELENKKLRDLDSKFENIIIYLNDLPNYKKIITQNKLTEDPDLYFLLPGKNGKHFKQITGNKDVMNNGIGSFQHIKKTNNFSIFILKENNYNENKKEILKLLDEKLKNPLKFAVNALNNNKNKKKC